RRVLFRSPPEGQPSASPASAPASGPAAEPNVTVHAEPEPPSVLPFTPVKLVYALPADMAGGEELTLTLWLEKRMDCGGREALVGVQSFEMGGDFAWSKVAVYTDTGEAAVSEWTQEPGLAFDDLDSVASDFDFYLTLNDIFVRGGENFMADQSWNSTAPTILRNVVMGSGISNYSVFRTGNHFADKALPCTEFSLVERGTSVDGTYSVCVADTGADVPLPFVVSVDFNGDNGPHWSLSSFSHEPSGVVSVTQCLEPVRCTYVPGPSSAQTSACEARDGAMEAIRDDRNCVSRYECWTLSDLTLDALKSMQNPACADPSAALVSAAVNCISQGKEPSLEYNDSGCISGVSACIG
ncbi:MAG: hypothetical protein PHQ80_03790, partial [Candidatus ainarchaeum sp.]|nr:hypothetical protein [Candidatus ainarchaeum sp.]